MKKQINLINEMFREHVNILNTIEKIKINGVSSKEGNKDLLLLRRYLLAHLLSEEDEVYPNILTELDEQNFEVKRIISNMEDITMKVLQFIHKYSSFISEKKMTEDFNELSDLIIERIENEERLYKSILKKYESLNIN